MSELTRKTSLFEMTLLLESTDPDSDIDTNKLTVFTVKNSIGAAFEKIKGLSHPRGLIVNETVLSRF